MDFCKYYILAFINPSSATICYFITYWHKTSLLPKAWGTPCQVCSSFTGSWVGKHQSWRASLPVACLWRTAYPNMRVQQLSCLLILPTLLYQLCSLVDSLGLLGSSMKICLTFGSFVMLCQSNSAPRSAGVCDTTGPMSHWHYYGTTRSTDSD